MVLAIACVTLIAGFWWAPVVEQPAWLDALNRLMAVGVMLTMIHVSDRRRAAEEAEKQAEGEIRILKGLLPICASCKAIRGAAGEWHKLETYLSTNSEAQFTHGLCPMCAAKYMDELSDQSEEE